MSPNHTHSLRKGRIGFIFAIGMFCIASPVKADQSGDWTYTSDGTNVTITGYTGTNGTLVIPGAISNMTVVTIGYAAFNPSLTYGGPTLPICVTIPQTVTNIGDYAFFCCPLVSITLSESLAQIGNYAFTLCPLTNIVIPDSVLSVGQCAFVECGNLAAVTLGSGLMTIGEAAFASTSISSITIPPNVVSIGQEAFSTCSSLTNVVTFGGLVSIGDLSFNKCAKLMSVTLGNNLTTIGDGAFDDCTSLSQIAIPTNVVYIGDCSFSGDSSLTSIDIPASVTNIGWAAYAYCDSLTNIHVSEQNTVFASLDGVMFSKDLIWLGQYPEGRGGSYTVPQGVKKICDQAFWCCIGLTNITFPNSVQRFGGAIDSCSNLTSIIFKGDQPQIFAPPFDANPLLTVYYYPWTSGWTNTFGGHPTQINPAYTQWLTNYGLSTNLSDDADNDGMLNWQEYLAGTNPTNDADRLVISSMGSGTNAQISWLAKSNVSYQVSKSLDLLGAWANAPSGTGTNQQAFQTVPVDGLLQYADPDYAGTTNGFYRVNVVP